VVELLGSCIIITVFTKGCGEYGDDSMLCYDFKVLYTTPHAHPKNGVEVRSCTQTKMLNIFKTAIGRNTIPNAIHSH